MAINKDFIIPDAGLQVNGAAVISSTLGVNGAVTIANTLTVNGALTVANTIAVGNTTVTGNVNVSVAANVGGAIRAGGLITGAAGADITGTANASVAINVGANVNLSVSAVNVGNSTSNTVVTQTSVNTGNSTLFTTIGQATGLFGNSTVNTFITNSSIRTGNSSVYTNVTATALTTNGTLSVTGNTTLNGANLVVSGHTTISNAVVISGNLTVSGTTTFVNTATLNVSDNIITLNSDVGAIAPSENAGVEVNRGTSANVSLIWNETADKWQITEDGTNFFNIHRKGTDVVLGTDTTGDYVATVASGNGLTGSGTGEGSTPTLAVVANTELTANSSGVHHNDITRTNTTTGNTSPNYAGTFTAVDTVTTNARGHVTGVNTKTVTMPSSNNTTYDMLAVANTTASNAILRLTDSGASSDSVFFVGTDEVVTSSNATHIIIDHADVTRADASSSASPNYGGTFTAVDSVTTNTRGHVTAINVKTVTMPPANNTTYDLTTTANTVANEGLVNLVGSNSTTDTGKIIGLDEIVISSNATAIYVDHNDVARANNTSAASPASGGTFTAIDSITTNARGHVTAINTKTVTLPIDPDTNTNTTYDLATAANTVANEGLINLVGSDSTTDSGKIVGQNEINVSSNATAVYVNHSNVTRSDASSSVSPASGGTFTAVDSVTTNARGHVTAINLKTVTLPVDPDTNTTYTGANGVALTGTEFRAAVGATLTANATGIHMPTVATAGSSSGGISAMTIDAQGRVTSVTGSAGYVTSSGVTSVTGTAPVVSSGGATPAISMLSATASRDGYMTSTFAAKLDGIAAGATNVTNNNQLSNGSGYITGSGSITGSAGTFTSTSQNSQFNSVGVGIAASTSAGTIRATGDITAFASSDRTFKTNITPIENALGKIRSLSGVMFDWTDAYIESQGGEDGYFVRKHDTGIIAQDVQAVLPEVVATREDGTLAVKYEKMMGLVIQSINELADLVDEMKKGS